MCLRQKADSACGIDRIGKREHTRCRGGAVAVQRLDRLRGKGNGRDLGIRGTDGGRNRDRFRGQVQAAQIAVFKARKDHDIIACTAIHRHGERRAGVKARLEAQLDPVGLIAAQNVQAFGAGDLAARDECGASDIVNAVIVNLGCVHLAGAQLDGRLHGTSCGHIRKVCQPQRGGIHQDARLKAVKKIGRRAFTSCNRRRGAQF